MNDLFKELKRRHVFRIGIAYLVVAWLVTQVVVAVSPVLQLPDWFPRAVLILLAIGFPIALILAWAFEVTAEGIKRTEDANSASAKPRGVSTGRKLDFVIIGALVLALGYFAWGRYYGGQGTQVAASGTPSIAVLPFEDYSPNHDQGYFADGIAEEILNSLAGMEGLEVTARTSSFYFKGKNEDLRTIGEKLGVANILEGSVRKEGDDVRITAQLNDARTGNHIWSKSYNRKMDDIFTVQENIAQSVAQAIGVTLGVGNAGRLAGMTRNPDAYDEYLKGVALANRLTEDGIRKGLDHFERARMLDPSFALAWAGIAAASQSLPQFAPVQSAEFWREKARDAISRAYDLARDSPQVLITYINIQIGDHAIFEAGQLFEKAIDEAHGSPQSNLASLYGGFLLSMGRVEDARSYLERVRKLNPLVASGSIFLGELDAISGDLPDAFAEFDHADKLAKDSPDNTLLFVAHSGVFAALASGDRQQIEKWTTLAIQEGALGHEITDAMRPVLDDPKAALAELHRLAKAPENQSPLLLSDLAHWAAYFGGPDFALDLLRTIPKDADLTSTIFAIWRPLMKDVRMLPGFKDLVRDIGLVDYWRRSGHWSDFCRPVSSGNGGDNDFECK